MFCVIQNNFLMFKSGISLEIGWKKKSRSIQTGMEYMLTFFCQSKVNLGVDAIVNRDQFFLMVAKIFKWTEELSYSFLILAVNPPEHNRTLPCHQPWLMIHMGKGGG